MKSRRGYTWMRPAALALAVVGLAACGEEARDDVVILASADWNDSPGPAANLGYRVRADVGWVDRTGTCARIPEALRVTVNDIETTQLGSGGACPFDALFEAVGLPGSDSVTVRLFQGDRRIGEATFAGMFWGADAEVISPAEGTVSPGDEVQVSIPPGKNPPQLMYARWHWLGTAPSVPTFYTHSTAILSADFSTFTATVPDMNGLTGPVALTFNHGTSEYVDPSMCTGFSLCVMTARYTLGPMALEVVAR